MAVVVFSADERKAISRRLVKIPVENQAFTDAQAVTNQTAIDFTNVDLGNKEYYDLHYGVANNYEIEKSNMTGSLPATFLESDLHDAALQTQGNLFFPTVAPFNFFLNPLIITQVNGQPFGSLIPNETGLMSTPASANSPSGNGITQVDNILRNGFNYGPENTTTTALYTIGDTVVHLTAGIATGVGDYVVITGGGHSMIGVVLSAVGLALNIYPLTNPTINLPVGSGVTKIFTGFAQAERQSLVAAVPAKQDILNGLTLNAPNGISVLVNNWLTTLTNEINALNANVDDRVVQIAQIAAAKANDIAMQGLLNVWVAFANTGVNGKFDNPSLAYLLGLFAARVAQIAARNTQIITALGGVVDNLDGTFTFQIAADDIYYQRYLFLNVRINRAFGSLTRALRLTAGNNSMQGLKDNNIFLFNTYSENMSATLFTKNGDGTNKINVADTSLFASGQSGYVISESQPEIAVTIKNIAQGIVTLDTDIPNTYIKSELARLYITF